MEIRIELPGVKLGIVEADNVSIRLVDPGLMLLADEICERKRREFTVETLAEDGAVRNVRGMFRQWGIDPSKYRPSSEALLRRVAQGKGVCRVSILVDIGNLGSVETGWPYGCYDRARLRPPFVFRAGALGESYEGIGKRVLHLDGKPVLADGEGPFGSPISDSTRSMISESAVEIMAVIYAPETAADAALESAMTRLADRAAQFAGAHITYRAIQRR